MNAIVVYESIYGNTRAVADGLGGAEVVPVHEAGNQIAEAKLCVDGGPTHMHGLATTRSRQMAAEAVHTATASSAPRAFSSRTRRARSRTVSSIGRGIGVRSLRGHCYDARRARETPYAMRMLSLHSVWECFFRSA